MLVPFFLLRRVLSMRYLSNSGSDNFLLFREASWKEWLLKIPWARRILGEITLCCLHEHFIFGTIRSHPPHSKWSSPGLLGRGGCVQSNSQGVRPKVDAFRNPLAGRRSDSRWLFSPRVCRAPLALSLICRRTPALACRLCARCERYSLMHIEE